MEALLHIYDICLLAVFTTLDIYFPSYVVTGLVSITVTLGFITFILSYSGKMPGVRCPRCAEQGYEQWVLPGKHCPRCGQPC